jgi:hypothetical protein
LAPALPANIRLRWKGFAWANTKLLQKCQPRTKEFYKIGPETNYHLVVGFGFRQDDFDDDVVSGLDVSRRFAAELFVDVDDSSTAVAAGQFDPEI